MTGGVFLMMFFPTLYLAQVKGYSPIEIGLAYLPWPVAMAGAGTVAQKIIAKKGPKPALSTGLLIVAAGLFALGFLDGDSSYATGILPGMLLTAVGAGFAWAALFLVASVGVSPRRAGLINTSQQLGSAIGPAAISSVAASYTSNLLIDHVAPNLALAKGFDRGLMIGAAVLVASALAAIIGLRSSDGRHTAEPQAEQVPVVGLEPALGD
nr:MFS transporter [uncultured Actinoplanes sp.]